jgi:hypothetical protein
LSGTIFGLPLSQQITVNGTPMIGALLYLYTANTTTPVQSFADPALTAPPQPWPLTTDANGRLPAFWLADGSYRARLTDSFGVVQFDWMNVLAIGPSSITGPPPPTFDPNALLTTGDVVWRPGADLRPGFARMNGNTIGPAGSPATEAPGALAYQNLFTYIWQNFSSPTTNVICPVLLGGSPSLGASAIADWNAGKVITLLDMRGKVPYGLDTMGATAGAAGRFASAPTVQGGPTTPGGTMGEETHVLSTAELAAHQHAAFAAVADPGHTHTFAGQLNTIGNLSNFYSVNAGRTASPSTDSAFTGVTVRVKSSSGGATDDQTALIGSSSAHNIMSLGIVGTWYQRM